jgi:Ca2+:H+ antiporter
MAGWLRSGLDWRVAVPVLAIVALGATWGGEPGSLVLGLVGVLLAGSVLAAVHHAEVVAHCVGEPFGALILAVAVTVIEVGLIVTLMVSSGADQTVRHRDYFVPPETAAAEHASPPSGRQALASLGLLLVALVAVVGLAKVESPAIEDAVAALDAPATAVGVVIALLVLAPETLAAVRNARRGRVQTSLNLALGSAMASIGLTIPVIAIASIWLEGPLVLGLEGTQIVLLGITAAVGALTVLPGRATLQEGGVHLVLLAAFLVLAVRP